MILGRFIISGHSMKPTYNPGDQVVAFAFLKIKKGDVVVFKYKSKHLIKRVKKISGGHYLLVGDNKEDSLSVPFIKKDAIIGKVVFKI